MPLEKLLRKKLAKYSLIGALGLNSIFNLSSCQVFVQQDSGPKIVSQDDTQYPDDTTTPNNPDYPDDPTHPIEPTTPIDVVYYAPAVLDIPDQTVRQDQVFSSINLKDYVQDQDTPISDIGWSYTGNTNLNVNINGGIAAITHPGNWIGSETIYFTATDPQSQSDIDEATFTITEKPNLPPQINSIPLTQARENSQYNYQISAEDPENDQLNYTLIQAPDFLSIDSSGLVSGTPLDRHSAQTHPIQIEVTDNINPPATQSFNLAVENVETIGGWVGSMDTGGSLENILVELLNNSRSYSATTDLQGKWQIKDVLDGDYETTLIDSANTFETYRPRVFRVSKQKAQENKLTKNSKLLLQADREFIRNPTNEGIIRKWAQKPIWDIYTIEVKDSQPVPQDKIDLVVNLLKNDVSQFYQQAIIDNDINITSTLPTLTIPSNGHVEVYWDNRVGGGANNTYLNGNDVISGWARAPSWEEKILWMQEICEVLIGGFESNLYPSVFNDPIDYNIITLQPKDLMLSDIIYGVYARPAGNTDLGYDNYHDVDPDGSVWNK
ncbi:MAG TPA: hypothetical protein VJH65_02870 [Candidatus Nanoarchaeia archaeon]|nr:hypothetical protein [Candidatus Nanoarchaeia archaeon]